MERVTIQGGNLNTAVERAAETLRHCGVVLFPTDTLYGLGADALSDEAVDRVYDIKGRDETKPIHCIVADMAMAERYAELDGNAHALAKEFLPGPLTLIVKKRDTVQGGIARGMRTIGIRIPRHEFCIELARAFGAPYTATSANLSGQHTPLSIDEICRQLGSAADKVALAIDAGNLHPSEPSTVVDLSEAQSVILREGAIPASDIWNTLRIEL